jgi:hypothetical protein
MTTPTVPAAPAPAAPKHARSFSVTLPGEGWGDPSTDGGAQGTRGQGRLTTVTPVCCLFRLLGFGAAIRPRPARRLVPIPDRALCAALRRSVADDLPLMAAALAAQGPLGDLDPSLLDRHGAGSISAGRPGRGPVPEACGPGA